MLSELSTTKTTSTPILNLLPLLQPTRLPRSPRPQRLQLRNLQQNLKKSHHPFLPLPPFPPGLLLRPGLHPSPRTRLQQSINPNKSRLGNHTRNLPPRRSSTVVSKIITGTPSLSTSTILSAGRNTVSVPSQRDYTETRLPERPSRNVRWLRRRRARREEEIRQISVYLYPVHLVHWERVMESLEMEWLVKS